MGLRRLLQTPSTCSPVCRNLRERSLWQGRGLYQQRHEHAGLDRRSSSLGKRSGDFSYNEICEMVRAVEAKRDEEFNKNVDLNKMMNANKEETSASEEKVVTSN